MRSCFDIKPTYCAQITKPNRRDNATSGIVTEACNDTWKKDGVKRMKRLKNN